VGQTIDEAAQKIGMAEREGFEPTVRLPVQWFSSSKTSRVGAGSSVAKRVLLFAISNTTMLACDVQYRAVPRRWFAIWFANVLERASTYIDKADHFGAIHRVSS